MASSFNPSPNITSGDTQASGSTHQFTGSVSISGSLTVDGSSVTGDTSPGGSNTQVQFNDGGSFGGDAGLTFNKTSNNLIVSGDLTASAFNGGIDGTSLLANTSTEIGILTASAGSDMNYASNLDFLLGNNMMGSSARFKQFGSSTVYAAISNQGEVSGSANVKSGGQMIAANGFSGPSLASDTKLSISPGFGTNIECSLGSATKFSIIDNFLTEKAYINSSGAISSSFMSTTYFSASISAATNASCSVHNIFNYALGASLTLTALSPVAGASYLFFFRQDGIGSRVVTFSGFKWPGGTAPTLSTAAGAVDIVSGISDGTNIYADTTKNFS